jgi:hypothetical protein
MTAHRKFAIQLLYPTTPPPREAEGQTFDPTPPFNFVRRLSATAVIPIYTHLHKDQCL